MDERIQRAVDEALNNNVADRIREAVTGPVDRAILEAVSPSVLLEVESALGIIPDADPNHPANAMQDVSDVRDAVEDALRDAFERAVSDSESAQ